MRRGAGAIRLLAYPSCCSRIKPRAGLEKACSCIYTTTDAIGDGRTCWRVLSGAKELRCPLSRSYWALTTLGLFLFTSVI